MLAALALLLAVLAPFPVPAQAGEPDAEPAAVVQAFHAALAAGDAQAAAALLASDAVVLESGAIESRAEYLAEHLSEDIAFAQAVAHERSDVRVVRAGAVAWVSARSHSQGTLRGRAVRSAGAELIVLSREAAGWRIRAIHWSARALPDAPAPAPSAAP